MDDKKIKYDAASLEIVELKESDLILTSPVFDNDVADDDWT